MRRIVIYAAAAILLGAVVPASALPVGIQIGLRAGVAAGDSNGIMLGADVRVPGLSLLQGASGRFDIDGWVEPLAGGNRSSTVMSFGQIMNLPRGYAGAAVCYARISEHGVMHAGPSVKLIGGVSIPLIGTVEANVHYGQVSAVTGMMRFTF